LLGDLPLRVTGGSEKRCLEFGTGKTRPSFDRLERRGPSVLTAIGQAPSPQFRSRSVTWAAGVAPCDRSVSGRFGREQISADGLEGDRDLLQSRRVSLDERLGPR